MLIMPIKIKIDSKYKFWNIFTANYGSASGIEIFLITRITQIYWKHPVNGNALVSRIHLWLQNWCRNNFFVTIDTIGNNICQPFSVFAFARNAKEAGEQLYCVGKVHLWSGLKHLGARMLKCTCRSNKLLLR